MSDADAIRETLARYPKAADDGDSTAYAALFTEDAVVVSRSGVHTGRAAIKRFLDDLWAAQPPDREWKHMFGNHVITIDDDTAEVKSDMVVFECLRETPWRVSTVVRHTDRLVRQPDGRWLFAVKHMGGVNFARNEYAAPPGS